jgi:hypothetical protein
MADLTPEQAAVEVERIAHDPKYYEPKDPNVAQRDAERLLELNRLAAGAENRALLLVDGTHVEDAPDRDAQPPVSTRGRPSRPPPPRGRVANRPRRPGRSPTRRDCRGAPAALESLVARP